MLTFWNLAGVPLSYCHSTLYLANHDPAEYRWSPFALAIFYSSYLCVYWVWDTCNSQKNRFRQSERGNFFERKAFPKLPWQTVKNPKIIKTKTGDSILVDGWYGICRKIHYTCDFYFVSLGIREVTVTMSISSNPRRPWSGALSPASKAHSLGFTSPFSPL